MSTENHRIETDEERALAARLDRELNELLQELRVVQGGTLILVGFLLVIPFTTGFEVVTQFQKVVYYLTLLLAGTAAIVVVTPVAHHRLAFRKHDKANIVERGNIFVLAALALVGVTVLGIAILVTDLLFSTALTIVVSATYLGLVSLLWYFLPRASIRSQGSSN